MSMMSDERKRHALTNAQPQAFSPPSAIRRYIERAVTDTMPPPGSADEIAFLERLSLEPEPATIPRRQHVAAASRAPLSDARAAASLHDHWLYCRLLPAALTTPRPTAGGRSPVCDADRGRR